MQMAARLKVLVQQNTNQNMVLDFYGRVFCANDNERVLNALKSLKPDVEESIVQLV